MWRITSKFNYIVFFICLAFTSTSYAVGFGELKVYSYLDEPLVAELEILGLEKIDPSKITVSLASANDFVRAGMERPYFLTNLQFEIFTVETKAYVSITSTKVVSSPYLEFIIDLAWPDGNLIKDYTILIDPPPKNLTVNTRPLSLKQTLDKQQADAASSELAIAAQAKTKDKTLKKNQPTSFGDGSIKHADESTSLLIPSMVPDVTGEDGTGASAVDQRDIYQQQREEFEQREQQKPADAAAPQGVLDQAISQIKETESTIKPSIDVKRLANERSKHIDMYKDVAITNENEAIDFGDVIKPATAAAGGVDPSAAKAAVKPGAPGAAAPTDAAKPIAEVKPPQKKHGLFLLLAGFALGLIGAAGFIVRRSLRKKAQAERDKYSSIAPDEKHEYVDTAADNDFNLDEEEIELSPVVETATAQQAEVNANDPVAIEVDLDKFEEAFTQLDLDKFSTAPPKPAVSSQAKTVADLLNISTAPTPPASPPIAPEPMSVPTAVIEEITLDVPDLPTLAETTPVAASIPAIEETAPTDEEAIKLKLHLAKQYLDAGDKDSARLILAEIIENAKDEQKLEAEIMLSGIL